ncbi:MAG: hypothetical protein JWP81_3640 [Ferruginibacter sp.]|nr:hypothetical protein [Ferruginibacter sp.]
MKEFKSYRYSVITILTIVALVFVFTRCMNKDTEPAGVIKNAAGKQFAGSATCANCHKNIYDHHLKTAHYLTTRIAAEEYIRGSFENGKNTYAYDDEKLVAVERRGNGFYQVEYNQGTEKTAHRIDIVIGSGTMGQSFLTWENDQLFQLPITYFTAAHEWSNSPGYPNKIIFNRPITSRCLECHSTFAKTTSNNETGPEKFVPSQMIYGVDCEKCHGPAGQHVDFQSKNPAIQTAKYIINPARLSRQQNLDLCASCHGGRLKKTRPSFEFTVGDTLSHFFDLDTSAPDPAKIDVHGNQYGLLRASKCFRKSETLTCNTCHNPHDVEKGNTALFSSRCITCHSAGHEKICAMTSAIGRSIKNNCIDCHMPLKPSRAIAVFLPRESSPTAALIRSHYISIYPGETKQVLQFLNQKH